jgi:hypothetical protein
VAASSRAGGGGGAARLARAARRVVSARECPSYMVLLMMRAAATAMLLHAALDTSSRSQQRALWNGAATTGRASFPGPGTRVDSQIKNCELNPATRWSPNNRDGAWEDSGLKVANGLIVTSFLDEGLDDGRAGT